MSTPKKTVLEVLPGIQAKVKARAPKAGMSIKKFTSMLLGFSLKKLDAGEIFIPDQEVEEASKKEVAL